MSSGAARACLTGLAGLAFSVSAFEYLMKRARACFVQPIDTVYSSLVSTGGSYCAGSMKTCSVSSAYSMDTLQPAFLLACVMTYT